MSEIASKNLNKEEVQCVLSKIMRMNDSAYRQRAFVSLLAVSAFSEYLEEKGIKLDTHSNLHSVPAFLEEFDVFDIRTGNKVVIDIRAVSGDEYTQLCIPRDNFSSGLRADIYAGVRIDRALQKAEFIGYIKADDVPRTKGNKNYFIIDSEELSPVAEIDKAIGSVKRPEKSFLALDHDKAAGLFIQYIDGQYIDRVISKENKTYLIEHLTGCQECRKAFVSFSGADQILKAQKDRLQPDKDTNLRLLTGVVTGVSEEETKDTGETTEPPKEEISEDITAQTLENGESAEEEADEVLEKQESLEDLSAQLAEEPAEQEKETAHEPPEQQKPKKRHHRDWADELADDLIHDPVPAEIHSAEPAAQEPPAEVMEEPAITPEEQEQPAETKEELEFKEPALAKDISEQLSEEELPLEEPDPMDILTPLEEEDQPASALASMELQEIQEGVSLEGTLPDLTLADSEKEGALEEITVTSELKDEGGLSLDESAFTSELKEEDLGKALPALEQASAAQPAVEKEHKKEEPRPGQEDVDLMLEDILETLDDVEVINEEDDIDSLLSFIDQDATVKPPPPKPAGPTPEPEPVAQEEKPPAVSGEPDSYTPPEEAEDRQEFAPKDIEDEKHGDYATVLDSKASAGQEELDILVYEEPKSTVEEITQEDLLSIFDPNAAEEEYEDKSKKKVISLKDFLKDKNMAAFTAAITLSTTVLFMYLGQINSQVQVSSVIKQGSLEKWNEIKKQSKKDDYTKTDEKRDREPLRYYTREVVKTVKNEIPDKKEAKKEEKAASAQKEVKKEEVALQPEIPIKNISWELSATVARKPKIKKYFLDIGYMLKETLSRKLYDPDTEISGANVNIYAELDSRGNILKSYVYEGSGSDKIDEKCLSALQAALVQNKMPDAMSGKDKIKLKLLIRI